MLYSALHNRWFRLIAALAGEVLIAFGVNLFIVPLGLYSGGVLGVCQLFRTLLQTYIGVDLGSFDITGILYFIVNIPILIYGYRVLGRALAAKTIICTIAYSVISSISHPRHSHCQRLSDLLSDRRSSHRLWLRHCADLWLQQRRSGRHRPLPQQKGQLLHCGPFLSDFQHFPLRHLPVPVQR